MVPSDGTLQELATRVKINKKQTKWESALTTVTKLGHFESENECY